MRGYKSQDAWPENRVCAAVLGLSGRHSLNVEMFLGTRDRIKENGEIEATQSWFMGPLVLLTKEAGPGL